MHVDVLVGRYCQRVSTVVLTLRVFISMVSQEVADTMSGAIESAFTCCWLAVGEWVRADPTSCPQVCDTPAGQGTNGTVKCKVEGQVVDDERCNNIPKPEQEQCPKTDACGALICVCFY